MNGCFNCAHQNSEKCKTCRTTIGEFWEQEVKTNFDRLQTMSINEFATWLTDFCCATVGNAADARVAMYHCGLREWLEQEATK